VVLRKLRQALAQWASHALFAATLEAVLRFRKAKGATSVGRALVALLGRHCGALFARWWGAAAALRSAEEARAARVLQAALGRGPGCRARLRKRAKDGAACELQRAVSRVVCVSQRMTCLFLALLVGWFVGLSWFGGQVLGFDEIREAFCVPFLSLSF
jgi:hypothetical protein